MSTTRKLREHMGWVYDPKVQMFKRVADGQYYKYAASVVLEDDNLTDDDHAPLMDLRKNPYEPVPMLEMVVCGWYEKTSDHTYITNEDVGRLFSDLRTAFPHIDTPEGA